jgi:hypothetical protein
VGILLENSFFPGLFVSDHTTIQNLHIRQPVSIWPRRRAHTQAPYTSFILADLMIFRSCSALQQFHFMSSILQLLFSLGAYRSSKIRSSIYFSECQLLACVPESKIECMHAFVRARESSSLQTWMNKQCTYELVSRFDCISSTRKFCPCVATEEKKWNKILQ